MRDPDIFTDDQFDLISLDKQAVTLHYPLIITISGFTGDSSESLAVASCLIELFAKLILCEVAMFAGGY